MRDGLPLRLSSAENVSCESAESVHFVRFLRRLAGSRSVGLFAVLLGEGRWPGRRQRRSRSGRRFLRGERPRRVSEDGCSGAVPREGKSLTVREVSAEGGRIDRLSRKKLAGRRDSPERPDDLAGLTRVVPFASSSSTDCRSSREARSKYPRHSSGNTGQQPPSVRTRIVGFDLVALS